MKKSCLNCAKSDKVFDINTKNVRHVCSLDKNLRVNGRMHCEEWSTRLVSSSFGIREMRYRNLQSLIKM